MEMLDITSIIEAILTLVIAIVGVVYTKARKENTNAEQLDKWVQLAVGAAEQAYKIGMTNDRKAFAKAYLESKGVTINWDKLDDTWDDVDMMIEAAVNQLPSGTTPANAQKGETLDVIAPKEVHK